MKPRIVPAVLVLAALLLAAPVAQATRTAPSLGGLEAGQLPALLLSRPAPGPPLALPLLSPNDRAIAAALASLDEPDRAHLLALRHLRLTGPAASLSRPEPFVWGQKTASRRISWPGAPNLWKTRIFNPDQHQGGLFLELDPLGPVDSPNLYQAFGFDGLNVRDPFGLAEVPNKPRPCSLVEIGCDPNTATMVPNRWSGSAPSGNAPSPRRSIPFLSAATAKMPGTPSTASFSGRIEIIGQDPLGTLPPKERLRAELALSQRESFGPTIFRLVRDFSGHPEPESVLDEHGSVNRAVENHSPFTLRRAKMIADALIWVASHGKVTKSKGPSFGIKGVADVRVLNEVYDEEGRHVRTDTGVTIPGIFLNVTLSEDKTNKPYLGIKTPDLSISVLGVDVFQGLVEKRAVGSYGISWGLWGVSLEDLDLNQVTAQIATQERRRAFEYKRVMEFLEDQRPADEGQEP